MSLILTAYAQVIYMLNVINKSVVPPSLQFGHRLWGRGRWSADEGVGGAVPPAGHRNHRGDQDYEHIRQAGHLRKDRVARLGICAGLSLEPYVGLLKAFSEWNFSWKWQSVCYLCSDIDMLLPKHCIRIPSGHWTPTSINSLFLPTKKPFVLRDMQMQT